MAKDPWWKTLLQQVKGDQGAPSLRKWSDDVPIDRRRFFRAGLAELLKPLSTAVRPIEHVAKQLGRLEPEAARYTHPAEPSKSMSGYTPPPYAASPVPVQAWLRPPGAMEEKAFAETCSKCGECVRVCPAQCIQIDSAGMSGGGLPVIDVETMPCVLCDGLLCMQHCPSGALKPVPLGEIDMGTAVWHEHTCLINHGQECTVCVDHCPVGKTALELINGRIEVHEDGCTGCGVCQHDCPTAPKSITVVPKSAWGQFS